MKNLVVLLAMAAVCAITPGRAADEAGKPTPAGYAISAARKAISDNPKDPSAYGSLALAFLRRARETGGEAFITQAEGAVKQALELAPADFETRKVQVSVLLARHLYREALAAAVSLNKKTPDDVMVYGFLTEAYAALGNYDEAEKSAEWMLNMRRGNVPAYIQAAQLREVFGLLDGAYEFWDLAYQSTPENESEERAWLLTHMAHVRLMAGKTEAADKLCQQAISAFPDYYFTLRILAQVRLEQRRYDDAVGLLRQLQETVPRPANLYWLAGALQTAGHDAEAHKAYADFEAQALKITAAEDNCNRALVFYYADVLHKPAQALEVARREYAWRKDVYTLDAYAWALHVNGQDAEARAQIEAALKQGTRDAAMLRRAGDIALKLGDRAAAERYFKQSVELNTLASEPARLALAAMTVHDHDKPNQ